MISKNKVSLTFDLYLMNVGSSRIGELLNYLGVKTVTETTWENGTINGMLCNEKYKGDFHLQKYYIPEGISETNTKKRDEFNRMIADCRAGKIDMIIRSPFPDLQEIRWTA